QPDRAPTLAPAGLAAPAQADVEHGDGGEHADRVEVGDEATLGPALVDEVQDDAQGDLDVEEDRHPLQPPRVGAFVAGRAHEGGDNGGDQADEHQPADSGVSFDEDVHVLRLPAPLNRRERGGEAGRPAPKAPPRGSGRYFGRWCEWAWCATWRMEVSGRWVPR